MSDGNATMIAAYERQAKRMDALAAKAVGTEMKRAFRKLAVEFRALAQQVRNDQDSLTKMVIPPPIA